jgi:hypothetical protein
MSKVAWNQQETRWSVFYRFKAEFSISFITFQLSFKLIFFKLFIQ